MPKDMDKWVNRHLDEDGSLKSDNGMGVPNIIGGQEKNPRGIGMGWVVGGSDKGQGNSKPPKKRNYSRYTEDEDEDGYGYESENKDKHNDEGMHVHEEKSATDDDEVEELEEDSRAGEFEILEREIEGLMARLDASNPRHPSVMATLGHLLHLIQVGTSELQVKRRDTDSTDSVDGS